MTGCPTNGNGTSTNGENGEDAVCGDSGPNRGCKVPGAHMAVGYWGRSIHQQVFAEQEQARQRALLTDQIFLGGIRAELWQAVTTGPVCGCYKLSNQQADRKCSACHGVGKVPGYTKFGYKDLWMSGVDSDITLTGVQLTKNFKSAKITLVDGALTGVIESGDKPFNRTVVGSFWDVDFQVFNREDTTSVVIEYSLDSGSTWTDVCALAGQNPVSGTIRFRATLTRPDANTLSPFFEMLRVRYQTIEFSNYRSDENYRFGPWILIMREPPSTRYNKQEYGDVPLENGLEVWTAGLATFDPSIEPGSDAELVKGPEVFIEILDGARKGNRYLTTQWKNSDPFAYILISQTFQVRIIDEVEPLQLVW